MELQGEYAPPAIGQNAVPIPLIGPGRFAITPEGLAVSGYKKGGAWMGCLMLFGVLGLIFAFAIGMAFYGPRKPPPRWLIYLVAGVVVAGVMHFMKQRRSLGQRKAQPWAFTIPWSSVTDVSEDVAVRGAIVVRVKKHKPSGTLHFQPPEGTSVLELISAIKRAANLR